MSYVLKTVSAGPYTLTLETPDRAIVAHDDGTRAIVRKLLADGDQNPKTAKNEVETRGLTLAPHNLAGVGTVCSYARTCPLSCLNEAGQGSMPTVQRARIARTLLWRLCREWFLEKLNRELAIFRDRTPADIVCGVRANMLSDIPWEKYGVPQNHPGVSFYDYTKNPHRYGKTPSNYHLTFSYDGTTESLEHARRILADGGNVSVVFYDTVPNPCGKGAKKQRLPESWQGFPVIDGTKTDWRPDDTPGVVVGLKLLAKSYRERMLAIESNFAQKIDGTTAPIVWNSAA